MQRQRNAREYSRRRPTREPYDSVLIVCEGQKTEPLYFRGLRVAERLSSANVHVTPADGTDPLSIVRYAEKLAAQYTRTFCVFDRDGHATYDQALRHVAQSELGRSNRLVVIPSWPCFELWLILHFRYHAAPIVASGRRSSADNACRELQRHIADYQKGRSDIYNELLERRTTAITNSRRLQRENASTGAANPSTRVHELVEYLLNLRLGSADA